MCELWYIFSILGVVVGFIVWYEYLKPWYEKYRKK